MDLFIIQGKLKTIRKYEFLEIFFSSYLTYQSTFLDLKIQLITLLKLNF